MKHPYIPEGRDQQGRRSVARHTPRTMSECIFDAKHAQAIASKHSALEAGKIHRGDALAEYFIAALVVLFIGLVAADVIPLL